MVELGELVNFIVTSGCSQEDAERVSLTKDFNLVTLAPTCIMNQLETGAQTGKKDFCKKLLHGFLPLLCSALHVPGYGMCRSNWPDR
jgi:hypothetical protein